MDKYTVKIVDKNEAHVFDLEGWFIGKGDIEKMTDYAAMLNEFALPLHNELATMQVALEVQSKEIARLYSAIRQALENLDRIVDWNLVAEDIKELLKEALPAQEKSEDSHE